MKTKKYKIVYQEEGALKSKYIKTQNLDNETLPENIVDIKTVSIDLDFSRFETINEKDIRSRLQELSLMLESKLLLDDALNILIKNEKKKRVKEFLQTLKNSFSKSQDISQALENYKINPLIKSFFKITQDSGNVSSNISSLSKMINDNHEIKKEFKKSMTYPIILLITFFLSLIGIFKFVVPNFESIFNKSTMELPLATKILLTTKDIFENYSLLALVIFFLLFFSIIFIYRRSEKLKEIIDKLLVEKLFIISDLYKLKLLYSYFVVVDIMLKNNYEFLDSMVRAKVLLNNKYLFAKITQIENLLKNGKSVRLAFESTKLFDDVTLSLITAGEVTNSLGNVICEIKKIYKTRFDDKLKLFSILIEPLFFIIIMALIVWIILAIFVPLWSMSDMLKI